MAKQFAISFRKVSRQNIDLLMSSIDRIETPTEAIIDKNVIMEFMENVPTNIVSKVNEAVGVATPNLKDISTFEFTCESCSHKEKVTFELNPVNFSSAG